MKIYLGSKLFLARARVVRPVSATMRVHIRALVYAHCRAQGRNWLIHVEFKEAGAAS